MAAPPSLDDILTEAGFAHDEVLRSYLHHIRVRSVDALAHMFADGDALSTWVTRFTTAVQFGDPQQTVHLGTNDLVLGTTASLTAAWVRCRNAQPPAPAPPHTQPSQTTPGTQTAPAADPKVVRNSHRACTRNSYANTIHRQASSQRRSSSEPIAPSLACGTNITRASITPPHRWERFSPNGPSQPWAQSTIQPRTARANGPSRSIPTTRWSKPRPETGTHRT